MKIQRFQPGPHHAYLGKFLKQSFLDQGHNLTQYDPRYVRPPMETPPPRTPEVFSIPAPTTPDPIQEKTALSRYAEAGASRGMIRRLAKDKIVGARKTMRKAVRRAESVEDIRAALATRQQTVSDLIAQRREAYGIAKATPAPAPSALDEPPVEGMPGEPAPTPVPTKREAKRAERQEDRKVRRLAKRVLSPRTRSL